MAQRSNIPLVLMMIDIDLFKKINDRYGHPAGDHVIKTLAAKLMSAMRESDVVARVGGEEFAVLMQPSELSYARSAAERLRQEIEATVFSVRPRCDIRFTISIGLAAWEPSMGNSPDQLYAAADAALYDAKQTGRNKTAVKHLAAAPAPTSGTGQAPG